MRETDTGKILGGRENAFIAFSSDYLFCPWLLGFSERSTFVKEHLSSALEVITKSILETSAKASTYLLFFLFSLSKLHFFPVLCAFPFARKIYTQVLPCRSFKIDSFWWWWWCLNIYEIFSVMSLGPVNSSLTLLFISFLKWHLLSREPPWIYCVNFPGSLGN